MFHIRPFYYRLFRAYNKVSSSALSNWNKSNSTTLYGQQFAKIQNDYNGFQHHWNIQFKNQEFCQRSQFYSGNNFIYIDDKDANSSSRDEIYYRRYLRLCRSPSWTLLKLQYKKGLGKNGQKYFKLWFIPCDTHKSVNFVNIPVPQDAYTFVRGLDALIGELAKENFDKKFISKERQGGKSDGSLIIRKSDNPLLVAAIEYREQKHCRAAMEYWQKLQQKHLREQPQQHNLLQNIQEEKTTGTNITLPNSADNVQTIDDGLQIKCEFKLRSVELIGQRHKFKLELFYFPNMDTWDDQKQSLFIFNRSNRRSTTHDKIYRIILPLKALYWLREQMVEVLVRYDGTEPIEMEAPAKIPKQIQYYTNKISKELDE